MMENKHINTADKTFIDLCDEVDFWKSEAERWKAKYDELMKESIVVSNERLLEAKKGVATALMFALSVSDNENGDLVIKKTDRKQLSEQFKHETG